MFLETTMVTQLPFDDTHRTHINAGLSVFELKAQMKTEPLKSFWEKLSGCSGTMITTIFYKQEIPTFPL